MRKSDRPELEEFRRQMETWRSIILRNKDLLENDSWLEKQVIFWMESMRFLITELEIWDELNNSDQYNATIIRAQKTQDHIHELLRQLT